MKIDRKAFYCGILLVAAVPALLLWQSSNASAGTDRDYGKCDHFVEMHVSKDLIVGRMARGDAEALNEFCILTLRRGASPVYVRSWIDRVAELSGECPGVHIGRGRLAEYAGDREEMRREFEAAFACAKDDEERERVREMIEGKR